MSKTGIEDAMRAAGHKFLKLQETTRRCLSSGGTHVKRMALFAIAMVILADIPTFALAEDGYGGSGDGCVGGHAIGAHGGGNDIGCAVHGGVTTYHNMLNNNLDTPDVTYLHYQIDGTYDGYR